MPPIPLLNVRVVLRVLRAHGFEVVSQRGKGRVIGSCNTRTGAPRPSREMKATTCHAERFATVVQDMPVRGAYRNHFVFARTSNAEASTLWTHSVTGNGTDASLEFDCGFADLALADVILGPIQSACIDQLRTLIHS